MTRRRATREPGVTQRTIAQRIRASAAALGRNRFGRDLPGTGVVGAAGAPRSGRTATLVAGDFVSSYGMAQIPLFPLGNALFPAGVLHLRIFEVRYLDMIKRCLADGSEFGVVVLRKGSEVRLPDGVEEPAMIGTMARIDDWRATMPSLLELVCRGTTKFQLSSIEQGKYGLWTGEAHMLPDDVNVAIPDTLQTSADTLGKLIAGLQRDPARAAKLLLAPPYRLDECGWVADRWAELLPLPPHEKEALLGVFDPAARLARIQAFLTDHGVLS
ncbi:Lon protease 2 [Pandoraea terrigena]|uniref:Lon protease 2 n=2 Tax=Pandoraea terrigena TaxID=2508292 RepID=A0A5E4WTB9_9BURK|nr:Lon protease 2 [Pandoraea terrigena]